MRLPIPSEVVVLVACVLGAVWCVSAQEVTPDPQTTLGCHLREYTYKATRTDHRGRQCWDFLRVLSCWGRCDSFEIPDWRFPFKVSFHPVCMHDQKKVRHVLLRHCDPGTHPSLRQYQYLEAETCSCQTCDSSKTSCEWRHHIHAQPPSSTTPAPLLDEDINY